MINVVKKLVDSKGISVYKFRQDTGIAQRTAYDLYNDPKHLPSINTLIKICDAYDIQPTEVIKHTSWKEYQQINCE